MAVARPLRILYPGAFYHIMCRGNERRRIFIDDDDRLKFLYYLKESIKMYQVNLHVYTLMHNHFHLVVETLRANLSEFMRRFNICYTGWFHYHHKTCGHLYQGRYKAILVDADSYLLELSRYIHINPVRKKRLPAVTEQWRYLIEYTWSSLPGYLDKRRRLDYVKYDLIASMIGGSNPYKHFIYDGLENGTANIPDKVRYQMVLGNDGFVARMQKEHVRKGSIREQPSYRTMSAKYINSEKVLKCVNDHFGVSVENTKSRHGYSTVRGIAAEMLYQYCNISMTAIGKLLGGINYTAVSMLRYRLKKNVQKDRSIQKQLEQIARKLQDI